MRMKGQVAAGDSKDKEDSGKDHESDSSGGGQNNESGNHGNSKDNKAGGGRRR